MKKFYLFTLITCFLLTPIFAQSADEVTKVIETKEVTAGQVAYFACTAAGSIKDNATEEDALNTLKKTLKLKVSSENEIITCDEIAWIVSNTWDVKGSLMYLIVPSPRYAYKQLKADGVIPSNFDTKRKLTGHEFLNILTKCQEVYKLKNDTKKVEK